MGLTPIRKATHKPSAILQNQKSNPLPPHLQQFEARQQNALNGVLQDSADSVRPPRDDGPDLGSLALDLGQIALDIIGIFEPTPFADLTNTGISAVRGDWLGAGLSLVGVIPYIGDTAKLGKLGKWAKTVADAVELAARNPSAFKALEPALRRISDAIGSVSNSVLDKLPGDAKETLLRIKNQIDTMFARSANDTARGLPAGTTDDILETAKGARPDPSTYMSRAQIDEHLALFDDGAVRITDLSAIEKYGTAGPPGGFVMPKADFDRLVAESGGDLRKLEDALGLNAGSLSNGQSVAVHIDAEDFSGLRVPSGNEGGVNSQWLPGGHTSGGVPEAVMDFSDVPFTVLEIGGG